MGGLILAAAESFFFPFEAWGQRGERKCQETEEGGKGQQPCSHKTTKGKEAKVVLVCERRRSYSFHVRRSIGS